MAISLAMAPAQGFAAPSGMVALQGHVPRQVQSATKMARVAATEIIPLSLAVRIDQNLLNQTLEEIYGRNAPAQKHYLSSAEFAQRFGIAQKRQAIKDFALANGLTVDASDDQPESMMVKVSGPSSVVEKTFHVQLNHYRAADGREFRAHDTEPMIPTSLTPHLGAVMGLSNLTGILHPHFQMKPAASPQTQPSFTGATGPGGSLAPADVKAIYGLSGTTLTGAGQTVAIFELDGYNPVDIDSYKTTFGLSNTPVTFIGVDGTTNVCGGGSCSSGSPGSGQIEVSLDIEMVLALASGVSQVMVYDGPNTGVGILDQYNKIATDNTAKVVSTSWGSAELNSPSFDASENTIFQRMAAQGQSFYAASGDSGAFDDGTTVSVDDPASQPFVTGVGGTGLTGSVSTPAERAWNSCGTGKCLQGSGGSSGGGVSVVWPIPSYQAGASGLASQTARNVPDVSLNADPNTGYAVAVGGGFQQVGGTSAAAPLWAGFTALLNQANAISGNGVLGFANPTLYQLGTGASTYTANFNDATSGDNGNYSAKIGYDNVTGFGSFKGGTLINSVTGILAILAKEQLLNVYAYPNPWDTRKYAVRQVTIANLPDDATVKLFTLSGFWVKNLTPSNGRAVWDLTNDAGARVASGLYFYTVSTPSAKTKGEIAIIK
jgi:subtilase family serine protease